MELEGSLPEYMHVHLKSWFIQLGTMHFIDIPFNLDLKDEDQLAKHAKKVYNNLEALSRYVIYCFVLILYTERVVNTSSRSSTPIVIPAMETCLSMSTMPFLPVK